MKQVLLFLALSGLLACSKEEPSPPDALVGTWRLITYCKPDNNGCTITSIPAGKEVFVTFTSEGGFSETYGNAKYEGYGFVGCSGSYVYEGKDIRIFNGCASTNNGQLVRITSISSSQLHFEANQTGEYILVR